MAGAIGVGRSWDSYAALAKFEPSTAHRPSHSWLVLARLSARLLSEFVCTTLDGDLRRDDQARVLDATGATGPPVVVRPSWAVAGR
jgi:hypothetical protein